MIFFSTPDLFTLDDQGMHTRLRTTLGDKTNHVVDVYRRNRPQASPTDLYFAITTGHVFWRKAIAMAERKGAFKAAPVYMFLFSYESEVPVSATARLARLLTPTRINLP